MGSRLLLSDHHPGGHSATTLKATSPPWGCSAVTASVYLNHTKNFPDGTALVLQQHWC